MKDIYRGTLVRLAWESPEVMAKAYVKWDHDSELHRFADSAPAQLWSEKKLKEIVEKKDEKQDKGFRFSIRTLADDTLIGSTSLWVQRWTHGDAWLGIYIGEREYWSKGYGTDAMRLIVGYGFNEVNLRRITLGLHAYNERALRSYQKIGFQLEGRVRGEGLRDGVRYDDLYMGILREEWLELNK
ncbi:MAG: GNAT family N-acetyltransferase [Anaerolineales bacterium]|nr:GNAT family N-acetyltransferase [Anaerolineales bacterium]